MSLVGRLTGHYRILDALGEGGMGEVFLAEDSRLRRPGALKMLGRRLRDDGAACERLAREARVASVVWRASGPPWGTGRCSGRARELKPRPGSEAGISERIARRFRDGGSR